MKKICQILWVSIIFINGCKPNENRKNIENKEVDEDSSTVGSLVIEESQIEMLTSNDVVTVEKMFRELGKPQSFAEFGRYGLCYAYEGEESKILLFKVVIRHDSSQKEISKILSLTSMREKPVLIWKNSRIIIE